MQDGKLKQGPPHWGASKALGPVPLVARPWGHGGAIAIDRIFFT